MHGKAPIVKTGFNSLRRLGAVKMQFICHILPGKYGLVIPWSVIYDLVQINMEIIKNKDAYYGCDDFWI